MKKTFNEEELAYRLKTRNHEKMSLAPTFSSHGSAVTQNDEKLGLRKQSFQKGRSALSYLESSKHHCDETVEDMKGSHEEQ